ncbi:DUF3040 domain-containing protein [Actinomycetospora soli]|uniref:DUF3040 domain-containing protein n=1 Tax=Actinomycetospora soli TaxID=2893887 RepID=UPI001E5556D6|nr:DUF3040 domain-containing protein [Actinomycetospora soli]MCD2191069.1 DUF3040 domain-containing protein [Actinomycetospora soli]
MADHELAPLTASETASLRAIAQELTRTDPRLLAVRAGEGAPRPGSTGAFVMAVCVVIGVSGLVFGVLPALVVGVMLGLTGLLALVGFR